MFAPPSHHRGVFQGACCVNRLTMLLFSRPAASDPGSTAPCLSAPSFVSVQTSVPGFSPGFARTAHDAEPGSDDPDHDAVRPGSRSGFGCAGARGYISA